MTTVFSIILMLISISSLVFRGLNPGIDFTGGFLVEVAYDQPPSIVEVRAKLKDAGFSDAIVQNFGSSRDLMIRILPRENLDNKVVGKQILDSLDSSTNSVKLRGSEFVSPQVGEELTEDGGLAMIFALILIMI